MVENKEESLARARERGVQLGLTNVWFYQSNMDYYQVTVIHFEKYNEFLVLWVRTDFVSIWILLSRFFWIRIRH